MFCPFLKLITHRSGVTLSIKASGVLSQDIEEGAKVHLQVKYGLIRIINQEADLCENLKNVDLECPLKKGPIDLTKDVDLPKEIPPVRLALSRDTLTHLLTIAFRVSTPSSPTSTPRTTRRSPA